MMQSDQAGLMAGAQSDTVRLEAFSDGLLLGPEADPQRVRTISTQFCLGPPLQLAAVVLAFVSAEASVVLCVVTSSFFALPSTLTRTTAGRRRPLAGSSEQ